MDILTLKFFRIKISYFDKWDGKSCSEELGLFPQLVLNVIWKGLPYQVVVSVLEYPGG